MIEGFTTQVDYFMALADFFIGKPGPGSISEALQFGLPGHRGEQRAHHAAGSAITEPGRSKSALGMVVQDFREIAIAVEQLLADARFSRNFGGTSAPTRTTPSLKCP